MPLILAREAEAGGSESKLSLAKEWGPGQLVLHRKTLILKTKENNKKKKQSLKKECQCTSTCETQ